MKAGDVDSRQMDGETVLMLCGMPGPIVFERSVAGIAGALRSVLVGWPETGSAVGKPVIAVRHDGEAICISRPGTEWSRQEPSVTSAVCTLVVELMAAYVEADPRLGNLHAGAVELGGRLVVFPATNRAGKSTLVTAVGARGNRIVADDLLPVDLETLEGVASGCLPRLRLPLPQKAPSELAAALASGTVLTDDYYAYVGPAPFCEVRHGARAPIGAIVLLDRVDAPVSAWLEPVEADEALLRVLLQDTRSDYAAEWTFERYLDLIESVSIHRLTYSDIADAARCLEGAFANWPSNRRAPQPSAYVPSAPKPAGEPMPAADWPDGSIYRRRLHVISRTVGSSAFLVDTSNNEIHHLNALGLGLWNLLEKAIDEAAILDIFTGAFPDEPSEMVRCDVIALLEDFRGKGLIERFG